MKTKFKPVTATAQQPWQLNLAPVLLSWHTDIDTDKETYIDTDTDTDTDTDIGHAYQRSW